MNFFKRDIIPLPLCYLELLVHTWCQKLNIKIWNITFVIFFIYCIVLIFFMLLVCLAVALSVSTVSVSLSVSWVVPDTDLAKYLANNFTGYLARYRISGWWISGTIVPFLSLRAGVPEPVGGGCFWPLGAGAELFLKKNSRSCQKCAAPVRLQLFKVKSKKILNMYIFMFFCKKKIGGFFFFTRIQPNKIVIKAKTVNYYFFYIALNPTVKINTYYSIIVRI